MAVVSVAAASAASLGGAAAGVLEAGDAPVAPCDGDGFAVTHETTGGLLTTVTIGGVADPACEGGRLSLTVLDGGGAALASGGPVSIVADLDGTDSAVSVPVDPDPDAALVDSVRVSIEGP